MKEMTYYSTARCGYPKKEDFTTYFSYRSGECVFKGTKGDREKWESKNWAPGLIPTTQSFECDEAAYKAARKKYDQEIQQLNNEFRTDLENEFGMTGHSKAQLLFSMAWDRGHSDGFQSVYNEYQELVELVQ